MTVPDCSSSALTEQIELTAEERLSGLKKVIFRAANYF